MPSPSHPSHAWLGPGSVAGAVAAFDWTSTPLGPLEGWSPALKAVAALVVRSPAAMVLLWGHEGVMIYNDAFAVIAGARHPMVLGSNVLESWPEVADSNADVLRRVLAGSTLTCRDRPLMLERNGRAEEAWFSLDYSPVIDESGQPAGAVAVVVETTDKVEAQTWFRSEGDRLRRMFEQAPGFMALLRGPEHVFDLVNKAYLELVGHRSVIGQTVRQALPEIEGQGIFERLDGAFASGEAFEGTAVPVTLNRGGAQPEARFVDLVYQPVHDSAGATVGIFVQGTDVTERVATERAMRAGETRNRQILDSAVDYAIIAFTPEGAVTRWNEGARRIFGWTEEQMLGNDAERIFTPEDRAAGRMELEMRQALEKGAGSDERWHLRRSGERFWASGEMTPIRDDDGSAAGFVKVLRDRTEQHRDTEALRESEERLRRAQQAGGVGTFTIALDTNVVHGTRELFRIFGLENENATSLPAARFEALVIDEDSTVRSRAASRDAESAPLDVEYRIRRASDGALRWIARKAEYERDSSGKPLRLVGVAQDISDRKADQRAIEESAAQFETFAQALPNHVWTAPPSGLLDWFNDRVYAYSGKPRGALDGEAWAGIVHPDDLAHAGQRWATSLASGANYETEFRIRRADGEYRWHLARGVPIRTGDGEITRWVGTNTDIHERKLAETERTRDRDRIWTLSQELMLISDDSGIIAAVNPAATKILGFSQADMVGESLVAYVHPDDIAHTSAELRKISNGATTLAFENRYRTHDGSYVLLDWTALHDRGYIHAVARNITGERAATEERERIWTSINDLMATCTHDGMLRATNPAWQRILDYGEHGLAQRPFIELVQSEDRPLFLAVLDRLVAESPADEFELRMVDRRGKPVLVAWTASLGGEFLYLVGRDVTEQRAVEDALRQSQKMEAVGQLTGGIAHDFNNLLQGITGSLNLVQKRMKQGRVEEVDRFVAGALDAARRAAALTHRLLAFSRRQPLDPRPVDVDPLIRSMEDLLHRSLGERIRLEMSLAGEGLWRARCDPNQLENAVLNLVINSRDAMPDGGVLTIETSNVSLDHAMSAKQQGIEAGHYVCIAVSDTGIGMSADTMSKAFEPFFTTKPLGQGTGLGLSMIYGFARQSEGYAKIYSELGKGTTLKVYLPRYLGTSDPVTAPAFSSAAPPARAHETVLVVEDEPLVRSLILEVLKELGYTAIEAVDGPAGLAVLQSDQRIDLLITDMGLPGLNGRQIAEAGRLLRPTLRVLFMTGYAENASLASGFLDPGMAMVTKPFAMELLATRIREVLSL